MNHISTSQNAKLKNLAKAKLSGANGNGAAPCVNKKLRTELRRVMSDRVLRISKCSQQQAVDKIKQQKCVQQQQQQQQSVSIGTNTAPLLTTSSSTQPPNIPLVSSINMLHNAASTVLANEPADGASLDKVESASQPNIVVNNTNRLELKHGLNTSASEAAKVVLQSISMYWFFMCNVVWDWGHGVELFLKRIWNRLLVKVV